MKKDRPILAELRRLEAEAPDAVDLIHRTAENLALSVEAVMDALERDAAKPAKESAGLRAELFSDVAGQFERMEQPLSLAWMCQRNVSLGELQTLSERVALILRSYAALAPADRLAFVAGARSACPTTNAAVSLTTLGVRQSDAANHETTTKDENHS